MTDSQQNANPYVGPETFQFKDRTRFFGREREARDLLARVMSERLLLFYAQSGAGKSSLLNTRLIPQLVSEGFIVMPVGRVAGELPAGIDHVRNIFTFNLLTNIDKSGEHLTLLADVTITDFLKCLTATPDQTGDSLQWRYDPTYVPSPRRLENRRQQYVLIIDQFEEIISTYPGRWRDREAFFEELNQAMLDDPDLSVVLTLREDYVASLDLYAEIMADRLSARFRMERMDVAAAKEAIRLPAAGTSHPFTDEAVDDLAKNLSLTHVVGQKELVEGRYVEPVQLQVVCYGLWEDMSGRPPGPITVADVQTAGDVEKALAAFYEKAIAQVVNDPNLSVSDAQIRRWFSHQLITETGTRSTVYLNSETGEAGGLPNEAVAILARQFLVRVEPRAGGEWVELVHDRFVEPISVANERIRLADPLASAASLWDANNRSESYLLHAHQLARAREAVEQNGADSLVLSFLQASEQMELRRKSKTRKQWQIVALVLGVLLLVAVVGWIGAFKKTGEAHQQASEARKQATIAEQEKLRGDSFQLAGAAKRHAVADPQRGAILAHAAGKRALDLSNPDPELSRAVTAAMLESLIRTAEHWHWGNMNGGEENPIEQSGSDIIRVIESAHIKENQRSSRSLGELAVSGDGTSVAWLNESRTDPRVEIWSLIGESHPSIPITPTRSMTETLDVVLNDDGSQLAIMGKSADGPLLEHWDVTRQELISTTELAFSASLVPSVGFNQMGEFVEPTTHPTITAQLADENGQPERPSHPVISSDARTLVLMSDEQDWRIFHIVAGTDLMPSGTIHFSSNEKRILIDQVKEIAFSTSGNTFAIFEDERQTVNVWQKIPNHETLAWHRIYRESVPATDVLISLNEDGSRLAISSVRDSVYASDYDGNDHQIVEFAPNQTSQLVIPALQEGYWDPEFGGISSIYLASNHLLASHSHWLIWAPLDIDELTKPLCKIAGRSITFREWWEYRTALGEGVDGRTVCGSRHDLSFVVEHLRESSRVTLESTDISESDLLSASLILTMEYVEEGDNQRAVKMLEEMAQALDHRVFSPPQRAAAYLELCTAEAEWLLEQHQASFCTEAARRLDWLEKIAADNPVSGLTIGALGNFWRYTVPADATVTIDVQAIDDDLVPIISLYSAEEFENLSNVENYRDHDIQLSYLSTAPMETQELLIKVSDLQDKPGTYEVTVTEQSVGPLTPGEPIVADAKDARFWRFDGLEGQMVNVSVESVDPEVEYRLVLSESSGNKLANSGEGKPMLVDVLLPSDDVFLLEIDAVDTPGRYILSAEVDEVLEIEVGQPTVGEIGIQELWRFDGNANANLSITVATPQSQIDPFVTLRDQNGEELAYNDDSTPYDITDPNWLDAAIEDFPLPEDGIYYIQVGAYDDAGSYELTVETSD